MDARINKQRLGNMLAYDWLKILVAVAFAIAALSVFFTMVRTRATAGQTYIVYGHKGLTAGSNFLDFDEELEAHNVFSYDILEIRTESFAGNSMSDAAYSARRAAGEGTVMFVSGYDKDDPETEEVEVSDLYTLCGYTYDSSLKRVTTPADYMGQEGVIGNGLDVRTYFQEVETELTAFFGENWREAAEPDEALARSRFSARNGKDNRYRFSSAKFEAGVQDEIARVKKLRDDYLKVQQAFEDGLLSFEDFVVDDTSYAIAVCVGNLSRIGNLFYYNTAESSSATERLCLVILNNGKRLGDLRFETVSFLAYLAQQYAG